MVNCKLGRIIKKLLLLKIDESTAIFLMGWVTTEQAVDSLHVFRYFPITKFLTSCFTQCVVVEIRNGLNRFFMWNPCSGPLPMELKGYSNIKKYFTYLGWLKIEIVKSLNSDSAKYWVNIKFDPRSLYIRSFECLDVWGLLSTGTNIQTFKHPNIQTCIVLSSNLTFA